MIKTLKIALALCILCSLFIFVRATDFGKVSASIQQVGYKFGLLMFITGIAYYFGTLSWQYCLGWSFAAVSTARLFLIRHIGETVSLINPASLVGGETVKAMLLKDYNLNKNLAVASILSSRAIMVVTQLLMFTLAFTILALSDETFEIIPMDSHWLLYGIMAMLLLLGCMYFFWLPVKLQILTTKHGLLLKQKTRALRLKIGGVFTELRLLFKHHKKMLLLASLFAAMHWIVGSLEFYFILKFLGVKASIPQALLVDMGIIFFKVAGAFIPGQIGVEEYGNKVMLLAIGIPGTEIWITASILRRTRQLIWIVFGIGIYFLVFKRRAAVLQNT